MACPSAPFRMPFECLECLLSYPQIAARHGSRLEMWVASKALLQFSGRLLSMLVRSALALALAVPLLLAGCTDEPEPKMPDPTPSSSAPSPSPSESETAEVESAEEFIRRWSAIEAEMENTGDTAEYRELSSDCKACTGLAADVEDLYAAGGYLKWGGWTISRITPRPGSETEFVVRVDSSPTDYRERAGGPLKRLEGGRGIHLLTLEKDGTSWVLVEKAMVAE